MIYLSGVVRPGLRHPMLGFMNTPQMANTIPAGVTWAADNGCFSNPGAYTDSGYLGWLIQQDNKHCLFATAPDVLADHAATVVRSRPLLPRLRRLGYQTAFVAQDGWNEYTTPWDALDVLFIGGTDAFKLGAGANAIAAAKHRGKRVHMGRVNSYRRLRLATVLGCDSADGTFLKFAPDTNVLRMLGWFERVITQPHLALCGETPTTS
jgi:hypothetical protein